MKVALINGSPRGKRASSLSILNAIKDYLMEGEYDDINYGLKVENSMEFEELMWNRPDSGKKDFEKLLQCDAIVYAFPLYIDSIPSHLLRNLVEFEQYIKSNSSLTSKEIRGYVIVNNGFFEGKQNCLAIENMEHFCNRVGFKFEQAIGIGGGGMLSNIENVPFGHGPKKTIGNELKNMANNIKLQKGSTSTFVEPNIPAFIYKISAEIGWRMEIKKNGLKLKDLGRRVNNSLPGKGI